MKIKFEIIEQTDLNQCAQLFSNTFNNPPWNEHWTANDANERLSNFFACPNNIAIKAVAEQQIVGLLVGEIQRWDQGKEFYLKEMCVKTTQQRKGIGKGMMDALNKILCEHGVTSVYLITHRCGISAHFYASLGFSENQGVMVMGKTIAPLMA